VRNGRDYLRSKPFSPVVIAAFCRNRRQRCLRGSCRYRNSGGIKYWINRRFPVATSTVIAMPGARLSDRGSSSRPALSAHREFRMRNAGTEGDLDEFVRIGRGTGFTENYASAWLDFPC
jgi:hypothetical protein